MSRQYCWPARKCSHHNGPVEFNSRWPDECVQKPATFQVDVPFELADSNGVVMQVRVLHIQARTSLLQYAFPTPH